MLEKLKRQRDNCQSAMIKTDGEMKAIWEAKYTYFQGIIDSYKGGEKCSVKNQNS